MVIGDWNFTFCLFSWCQRTSWTKRHSAWVQALLRALAGPSRSSIAGRTCLATLSHTKHPFLSRDTRTRHTLGVSQAWVLGCQRQSPQSFDFKPKAEADGWVEARDRVGSHRCLCRSRLELHQHNPPQTGITSNLMSTTPSLADRVYQVNLGPSYRFAASSFRSFKQ